MTSVYAEIIGDPVVQSKSPVIHRFWLAKLGMAGEYRWTRVTAEGFADWLAERRVDPDWLGCNVTMPLKRVALGGADDADRRAGAVGAANLLVPRGGQVVAGNTDVDGVLAALPEGLMAADARVCLIGAGGAARAALEALRVRGVRAVTLLVRDDDAGRTLLDEFGVAGEGVEIGDGAVLRDAVVINATPLGMCGARAMPQGMLDGAAGARLVFDMVYDPVETALLRAARTAGVRGVDGLEMLVGQAATAFTAFFGREAPREHDAELRTLLTS